MWGACWIRWEEYRQCIGWGSTHSAWTILPKQQNLFINCLHKTVSWHCQRGRWRWCWCWRWPPPPSGGCRPHRDRFPSGYLSFFEVKNIKLNLDKLKDNCVTFWNKIRKIMGKSFFFMYWRLRHHNTNFRRHKLFLCVILWSPNLLFSLNFSLAGAEFTFATCSM